MNMLCEEIEALEQNGITRTAFRRIGDPAVIPLWFGEGDLVTPDFIRADAKQALDEGFTFYGHARGRAELRKAVKTYLDRVYGLDLDSERITVPGSSMLGVTIAAQMTLGRGDHAIIVTPHWPNMDHAVKVIGAEFDCIRQHLDGNGWHLVLDDIVAAARDNTRGIYVNSPSNRTSWVMRGEDQRYLLALCRQRGIVIIADEVYHRTVCSGDVAPSFLEITNGDDPLVVVNGFSKAYAMAGWGSVGWSRRHASLSRWRRCRSASTPRRHRSSNAPASSPWNKARMSSKVCAFSTAKDAKL